MNWAPEALRAEMDYRVERALGDPKTTLEHRRAAHTRTCHGGSGTAPTTRTTTRRGTPEPPEPGLLVRSKGPRPPGRGPFAALWTTADCGAARYAGFRGPAATS